MLAAIASIRAAVAEKAPDCIFLIHKAKEIDAQIEQELRALREIVDFLKEQTEVEPLVAGIVTQCDELDPVMYNLWEPPEDEEDRADLEEKRANIEEARTQLKSALEEAGFSVRAGRGCPVTETWG